LPQEDPLAPQPGSDVRRQNNRGADTSVSVPLIETAEGDKKPLDLLDEPMVWRGGRHGAANNIESVTLGRDRRFGLTVSRRTDGVTERTHVSPVMLQFGEPRRDR
jgi:hypothetical protein